MQFLPSVVRFFERTIQKEGFPPSDFDVYEQNGTVRFCPNPHYSFTVMEVRNSKAFTVIMSPGSTTAAETIYCPTWDQRVFRDPRIPVTESFVSWLRLVRRELRASNTGIEVPPPPWLANELPQRYQDLLRGIEDLDQEARRLEAAGRLLWQKGAPLEEAVRDVFRELEFTADLTQPGATYDVTVDLGDRKRLLVEVTGTENPVRKNSPKIAQLLQAGQQAPEEETGNARLVLAANVFLDRAPGQRTGDLLTPQALDLITGLHANFVTTATLFQIWKLGLKDRAAAQAHIRELHRQDGGLFRVPALSPTPQQ